jgi:glyoxylase-like metal-dependent hydrolase (beta-lactamase superfamily II)
MDAKRTTLSVGAYEAYLFFDGIYSAPITDIVHAKGAAERDRAIARWGKATFEVDVNCFGLHSPDGLILIDAGAGDHWGPDYGKASASMREAGFTPEEVSTVLLTHIHGDHALGLLDGEKARFPNADVRLPRGDFDYYGDARRFETLPESSRTLERLKRAYGVQLTAIDLGPVLPGVDAIALPGHTPGHTGYIVHDDRKSLLVWGDVVHLDSLQLADPAVGMAYDVDPQPALHSRQIALENAAREGWYIAGGHVTGIRQVERQGSGFAFKPE